MTTPTTPETPLVETPPPTQQVAGGAAMLAPPLSSSQDVIQQQVSAQDYVVLRFAVLGLLVGVAVSLVGVLFLAAIGKAAPEGVLSIGSACVGALATMLVRPPLFPPGRANQQGPPPLFVDRRQQQAPGPPTGVERRRQP